MTLQSLTHQIATVFVLLGLFFISTTSLANTDSWNGTVHRPSNGAGTEDNPILINSAEEFAFLLQNYDYNNGVCIHKHYKLTCDIDMSSCRWTYGAAGTENKSFRAHFDGDGHKISNIVVPVLNSNTELNLGVFPMLGGDEVFESVIENLEIDGITFEFANKAFNAKKQFNIGGLVGQMYRNSRIENCIVNGMTVKDANPSNLSFNDRGFLRIGGLVGNRQETFGGNFNEEYLETINIVNCYGLGSADLSNITGKKEHFHIELEQGTKSEGTHNGIKWHKMQNNRYSFFPAVATISEESSDASGRHFKAVIAEGSGARMRWTVDGKEHTSTSTECTVPFDVKDRSIAFELLDSNGNIIASDADLIQPADLKLSITSTKNGNSYVLKSEIIGEGSNALANEFVYSWKDLSNGNKVVGSSATLTGALKGHTYYLTATHRRWKFCTISGFYSFNNPIFVSLNGINADDAKRYTIDRKTTYPAGNDSNDGLSPEKAVRTMKKAYQLIKSSQIGNNIIVIMGDYDQNIFNVFTDEQYKENNPDYFKKDKPAIITGQYGNICNGKLLLRSTSCVIDADTRFENLTVHGNNDYVRIMAQEHDITFGHGMMMEQYSTIEPGRGLIDGSLVPNISIYGGFKDLDNATATRRENTIHLMSGYYGRVTAGSFYSRVNEETGNVTGTPRDPVRTRIIIDISNHKNPSAFTFDVGLAIAGQSNGSCYAVTSIDVSGSSRVGRAIGGNLGYGRKSWAKKADGSKSDRPSDSFFGQSTINIRGGNINEIYGTSLGRSGKVINPDENVTDSISTYFYGKSVINISGGMVRNTIYGAGGSGVTGLSLKNDYHTFDPFIPYSQSNGEIAYGSFDKIRNRMPKVVVSADSLIDLNKSSVTINVMDKAFLRGSVYGGGYGFSNQIYTSMALCQAGDIFGDTYINISGGTIDGHVFGGGKGTTSYLDNNDLTGYPVINGVQQGKDYFNSLAFVYGSTHINISGGTIKGMVFSGGEGSFYRPTSEYNSANLTSNMASVVGNTYLNISGDAKLNDFVFGGGNYGNILRSKSVHESGSTYVTIDGGKIQNSIFGGGHGHIDIEHPERSIIAEIEGDAHVLIKNGEFDWIPESSKFDTIRYYGIYGSGLTASIVHGDTYVEARRSLFSKEFLEKAGLNLWDYGKPWDKRFTLCGGGFGEMTDVMGNTNVLIDVDGDFDFDPSIFTDADNAKDITAKPYLNFMDIFGGGLLGNVEGSSNVTIKGRPFIRNVYGGSLVGNIGLMDMDLNGNIYTPSNEHRNYLTSTTVNFISGSAHCVFGGGLMGNICGETQVNIGSDDPESNKNIFIKTVYGGNDVTGSIAGSNNALYGTNINIYGGTINGNVYGSGNGQYGHYDQPTSDFELNSVLNASIGREHPHVASASISISGIDENNRTTINGTVYLGGNNTTVGQFVRDINDRPQYGQLREVLVPNSGRARLNLGDHVTIANLSMGSNGSNLMEYIPSYTLDGTHWTKGYESQKDFEHFCRTVDMSCVPLLTFNSDRSFDNQFAINDLYGKQKVFDTHDEMDAKDIIIGNFIGGGFSGSMTADSVYNYTLPAGLTITGNVIGGCQNAYFRYVETQGDSIGAVREYIGGFMPYNKDIKQYHRLQLNIFCKFAPAKLTKGDDGTSLLSGSNIFGGCYEYGIIHGAASINMHSDLIGASDASAEMLANLASDTYDCCQIFGAGKGKNTEVIGNTYVSLSGADFNGIKSIPNVINVYGGSMEGRVIGKSNVVCDLQTMGATAQDAATHGVWNKIFGGGKMGDVVAESRLVPGLQAPAGVGTTVRIFSGQFNEVFGGSRIADIEGGSFVEINDKGQDHFHTVINRVYGGSDVSGNIGIGTYKNTEGEEITTNTYVRITESPEEGTAYSGFPFIGELYAGGNGKASGVNEQHPDVDMTYLDIAGGTLLDVYGGANNSHVRKATNILVNYKDSEAIAKTDLIPAVQKIIRGQEVKYNINRLFGGNNQMDMTIQPEWQLKKGSVGSVYGGCNKSDAVIYNEEGDSNLHPNTTVKAGLVLNLDYPDFTAANVFGGCRMGNVHTRKIEDGKPVNVVLANNQYGTIIKVRAGKYGRIFGGNDVSGRIYNGTHVLLEGGEINEVFGAGNGEYIYQYSPDVNEITECYDPDAKMYYYKIPASPDYEGAYANDFQKMQAITAARPNIIKTLVEISGGMRDGKRQIVKVNDAIYGGGNCATVYSNKQHGRITLQIGDYCSIENLYLGSNGAPHIRPDYLSHLLKYNNMGSLSQTDSDGRTLLDYHMDAVIMYGLPEHFTFRRNYENCHIGSFFMGGNRGSLCTHGELSLVFPPTLKIRDKIVGGSNQADILIKGSDDQADIIHLGGILWDGIGTKPKIMLEVNSMFENENGEETVAQVYPGCYQSGKIEGEVNVSIK